METESTVETWICPGCGATNSIQNGFCKNCGYSHSMQPVSKKNWKLRIFLIVTIIILVGAVVFAGWFIYQKAQEEKNSRAYLQSQQTLFGQTTNNINGLASETDLAKKYDGEKNLDLVVQKIGDEKYKAQQAADMIGKSKASQSKIASTATTQGLNFLIASFYTDAAELSNKYAKFIEFEYDETKIGQDFTKQMETFEQQYSSDFKSDAQVIAYFQALSAIFDKAIVAYDGLVVPEGMDDYKRPAENLKDLSKKCKDLAEAIKTKNFNKAEGLAKEIVSSEETIETATKKADEISANYYSQLHDQFVSLRTKADKVKSEMVMLDAKLKVQPLDFSIEGW